ncbi:hypothetical protein BB987_12685 [Photorhabdus temperata]|uniref:Uncharacterized protein n=1 Tax=Photorhabdus khanii NC19 TaxID=1004151 RepID=W3VEL8_9GAMM|nr:MULTISPECIES: hypothetical protein [Photorhabdus]ETS33484.1 hypothetical protein PTE_00648 [Photorhabdus khanii NC19]OHV53426.1 hypothetical protein BB987_12685 [Photorhabdus temperata]
MANDFDVERTGLVFTLAAGNLPMKTFAVVGFTLNEALSTLFSLQATLTCANPDIDFADVLDKYATLTVVLTCQLPLLKNHSKKFVSVA